MNVFRTSLQILLPLAVLAGGAFLTHRIVTTAKPPEVVAAAAVAPLVRVATATVADVRLDVTTQGTVEPLRTVDLSAEVGGRIVATSDRLRAGGTFAAGTVLVTLDPDDFDFAVVDREAAVARAELQVLQERAEADAAARAWRELEGERAADPLVVRAPQIRDAEAALAAARAALAKSRRDRERTEVKAPFAGRVRSVAADQGQTVQPGQRLAVIVDDRTVEVRLPIPVADAAYLELPFGDETANGPAVEVVAEFAGARHAWRGRIVRTEGEIDRRTRQLTVVARIDAAANPANGAARPPLLVGQFVQARIEGIAAPATVVVPAEALRADGAVWVVDGERRLRRRVVDVLRREADRVLLRSGVAAGESVCLVVPETAGDGTLVGVPPPSGGAR